MINPFTCLHVYTILSNSIQTIPFFYNSENNTKLFNVELYFKYFFYQTVIIDIIEIKKKCT